jgi:tetratricopeptide (TPR) repeat protein
LFGDSIEVARQKLQTAAKSLDASDAVPALLSVLGLGGERVDLTREALFGGMRMFFEALTLRSPVLLILEDIHLAEDVTLDFLEQAADWIRNTSCLLLALGRPELLERRTTWMGGKRSATTLVLDPLRGEESRELASAILGGRPAPASLLDRVLERAEGNPLFVEEMLRALIERGVLVLQPEQWVLGVSMDQILIPDAVHAVIAARVDALPQPEKQILQTAAVQRKDFWLGGVHVVIEHNHVEETIRMLVDKELLIRKRRSTLAGEEEFTFRHILIRDVAYASIPKTQRWPKHVQVARWMEQIAGTRQAEFADIIAHHWLQVVAVHRELGLSPNAEAQEQAIKHVLLAGQRAAKVYANTTALDHFTRGMDLNPPSSARLQMLLGRGAVWMLLAQHDRAREDFLAVRALAQELHEPRWEAIALDNLGVTFRRQDLFGQALEHLDGALSISRLAGDRALTGRILIHIGFTYFSEGRPEEAIRSHEEARQLLEASDDTAGLAESYHGLSEALDLMGRFEESIERLLDSLKICDLVGNRSLAGENLINVALGRYKLGDYAQARSDIERCLAIFAEIGDVWNFPSALWIAAAIECTLGEFGKAIDYVTRGLNLAKQIKAIRFTVNNLVAMSMLHRELEDHLTAWQADQEALESTGIAGGWWTPPALAAAALDAAALGRLSEAETRIAEARRALDGARVTVDFAQEILHAQGRVLLAAGKAAEARHASKSLLKLADLTRTSGHWRIPALLLEADAATSMGEGEVATSIYMRTIEEATRVGRMPSLWRALAGLAEVQRMRGQPDAAASTARQAREIIDRLAASVSDERLRATFLQSAKVQQVMSLAGP